MDDKEKYSLSDKEFVVNGITYGLSNGALYFKEGNFFKMAFNPQQMNILIDLFK